MIGRNREGKGEKLFQKGENLKKNEKREELWIKEGHRTESRVFPVCVLMSCNPIFHSRAELCSSGSDTVAIHTGTRLLWRPALNCQVDQIVHRVHNKLTTISCLMIGDMCGRKCLISSMTLRPQYASNKPVHSKCGPVLNGHTGRGDEEPAVMA